MANSLSNNYNFILYTSPDVEVRVDVFIQNETVWLTQKAMQELFGRVNSNKRKYFKYFGEVQLDEKQVVPKF
jgi:hypothetical protein